MSWNNTAEVTVGTVHGTNIKTSKNYHSYIDAVISVLKDKLPLSYGICPEDIDILHPLPPNKKGQIPVIIKFIQHSIRNKVYATVQRNQVWQKLESLSLSR